ncbi:MAG: sodium:solute symporter family protein, partial [Candidatus Omnitrophica bacterium]|nr:sodium:solute symporter family protein [Candidatus Omnitrophota bacterium]
ENLKVSRVSVILISVLGLIVALTGEGIIPVLAIKTMGAVLVFSFLAFMFWKRATQKGIIASMVAGGVVTLVWHLAGNPVVIKAVAGYASALVALVVVSLLTSHSPDEQVKAAYFEHLDMSAYNERFTTLDVKEEGKSG